MKIIKRGIIGVVAVLLASAVQTFGIEGLKLSVHCPDVWLSWPSVEGEYDIVQWREDLSTNSTWVTLTNLLPAEIGTNITTFVHSNRVDCPTGQVFSMAFSGGGSGSSLSGSAIEQEERQPDYPTVIPKDWSRVPVPLGIYPPGLDLSGYIIIWPDGSTDDWSETIVGAYEALRQQDGNDPPKGPPITVNGVTYDDQIPWQVPGFITNFLFAWDLLGYGVFDSFVYSYLNLPSVQGWSVQPWDGLVI